MEKNHDLSMTAAISVTSVVDLPILVDFYVSAINELNISKIYNDHQMKHDAVLKQDFRSGTCIYVCMEFRDEGKFLTLPSLMYCLCFVLVFYCSL